MIAEQNKLTYDIMLKGIVCMNMPYAEPDHVNHALPPNKKIYV